MRAKRRATKRLPSPSIYTVKVSDQSTTDATAVCSSILIVAQDEAPQGRPDLAASADHSYAKWASIVGARGGGLHGRVVQLLTVALTLTSATVQLTIPQERQRNNKENRFTMCGSAAHASLAAPILQRLRYPLHQTQPHVTECEAHNEELTPGLRHTHFQSTVVGCWNSI